MDTVPFDPSKPFSVVSGGQPAQPQQTPAPQTAPMMPQAQQPLAPQRTPNLTAASQPQPSPQQQVPFDPSKPFSVVSDGQQQPQTSTAADVAHSAFTGLGKGLIGIAGAPGDLTSLVTGGKHGSGFGSEAIQKGIEGYTGEFYQPKTTLGRYAETAGSFAPAAVLPAGELGLGARLLRMVAAPAIASETAGELTQGTAAEPYARAGAAILGGGLGAGLKSRAALPALKNAEQIEQAATTGYQSANLKNVVFKDDAIDSLQNQMRSATLNSDLAPTTHKIIDTLDSPVAGKANFTWEDVQTARQLLGDEAGRFADPVAQGAAVKAKKALDTFLDNLDQSHLQSGDANLAVQTYRAANANWAAKSALNALSGKEYAADLSAAAANSGANYENVLRQRLKTVLLSKSQRAQFSSDEIKAMEDIVKGGVSDNSLRALGNLMGGGGGLGAVVSGGAGALAGLGLGGLAIPAAGAILKGISNRIIGNKVGRLSNTIAARAPANAQIVAKRNAIAAQPNPGLDYRRALLNAALSRQPLQQ